MVRNSLFLLALFNDQSVEANSSKPWRAVRHAARAARAKSYDHYKKIYDTADAERREDPDQVTILTWWAEDPARHPWMTKSNSGCGGCYFTNNRDLEKSADALLIDNTRFLTVARGHKANDTIYKNGIPDTQNRNQDQYWVFWPREAASKGIEKGMEVMQEHGWDGAFNLTTAYRRDSDVPRPFGNLNKALIDARWSSRVVEDPETGEKMTQYYERQTAEEHIADVLAQKLEYGAGNHTVWMVSNCQSTRGAVVRQQYVQRLIGHGLKLDGFGECFDNILVNSPWSNTSNKGMKWGKFAKYKFYLAFENSIHCNDYMSEKVWRNSLEQGLVPVIYGPHPDDVKAMAPPNSYIHVEDFATPHDLVKYLNYLDKNDTAYAEYHSWRAIEPDFSHQIRSNTEMMKCGVCEEIKRRKAAGFPKRTIESVANWWWVNNHDSQCTSGNTLSDWVLEKGVVSMDNQYDEAKYEMNPSRPKPKPAHNTVDRSEPTGQFENFIEDTQEKTTNFQPEVNSEPKFEPETEKSEPETQKSAHKTKSKGNKKAKLEEKKNPKKK